jgi:hypothetical protein
VKGWFIDWVLPMAVVIGIPCSVVTLIIFSDGHASIRSCTQACAGEPKQSDSLATYTAASDHCKKLCEVRP